MAIENKKQLTPAEIDTQLKLLKTRFEKSMKRHAGLDWNKIQTKLELNTGKLWSLHEMEKTGGEPDVVGADKKTGEIIFFDCATESPAGRRSLCYDGDALNSRKEFKPENSAVGLAEEMGIELLTEAQYRDLQQLGSFDAKTSSWLKTPAEIRKLGGAIFGDFRFGTVFIYHNGVQSYYGGRGFRGVLRV